MHSVVNLLPYAMVAILTAIPSRAVLKRIGLSRWWTLLSLAPLGMIVILWLIAFWRWPQPPEQNPS
jgi:hypothetical protein